MDLHLPAFHQSVSPAGEHGRHGVRHRYLRIFPGHLGETLAFYVAYGIDWFVGGFSVIVVNTLIWPHTTERVFLERLAAVYAHLEEQCRRVARQIRSGESPPVEASAKGWQLFRPLRRC